MRRRKRVALERRMDDVAALADKIDRKVDRIEVATIVREPNTAVAADAYDGLRKQVIAATGERNAHMHQLARFHVALRAGATADELHRMVSEWMGQASVQIVEDPAVVQAFEFVGPADAPRQHLVDPAYVDAITGRVIKQGVVERLAGDAAQAAAPAPAVEAGPSHDGSQAAEEAGR